MQESSSSELSEILGYWLGNGFLAVRGEVSLLHKCKQQLCIVYNDNATPTLK